MNTISDEILSPADVYARFGRRENSLRLDAELLCFRFVQEIDEVMEKKAITKKDLAASLGTSVSYLTRVFRGDKLPSLELLARIQRVLEMEFRVSSEDTSGHPSREAVYRKTLRKLKAAEAKEPRINLKHKK